MRAKLLLIGIAVPLLLGLVIAVAGLASASGNVPTARLTQLVLRANEIPGYVPKPPAPKPLGLAAFLSAVDAPPSQRAILAQAGFVHGAVETLKPPVAVPAGAPSESAVALLGSPAKARAALPKILSTLPPPPGPGFKVVHFRIPGVPGSAAKVTSKGPVDVYNVFFTAGPYVYNVDAATANGRLSRAQFIEAIKAYYQRVK